MMSNLLAANRPNTNDQKETIDCQALLSDRRMRCHIKSESFLPGFPRNRSELPALLTRKSKVGAGSRDDDELATLSSWSQDHSTTS